MILFFNQIGAEDLPHVGGKGANLGELTRAGFPVPPGFCVTTEGFHALAKKCAALPRLYDELDAMHPEDVAAARRLGQAVRDALMQTGLPEEVARPALEAFRTVGASDSYAVRSSATAEDLPGASFAGQQDTYLNIRGEDALLSAILRCFASLFTDRAILYRAKNGFGHRSVALSVVVQKMVFPDAAGILFTADPINGHRGTLTIDAGFGLGEALVGGLVTADLYRIDKATGAVKEVRVGDKAVSVRALPEGGTVTEELPEAQRHARVLDEAALTKLAALGCAVEKHYGNKPQDIEWCLEKGELYLVQARPITSLFPLPEPKPDDGALHVYLSFSHAQNMIEPITPLGRELWSIIAPFGKASIDEIPEHPTAFAEAGGRLYIDVTRTLRVKPLRKLILTMMRTVYPDVAAGVESLADRKSVQASPLPRRSSLLTMLRVAGQVPPGIVGQLLWSEPETQPLWADAFVEKHARACREAISAAPAGGPRLREARRMLAGLFHVLPQMFTRVAASLIALGRLRKHFANTPHAADVETLQRGLIGNVTTEMDLQVGDLAEVARPYPELIAALRRGIKDRADLESLRQVAGGPQFLEAFEIFLSRYGMRGQAEIDIGRPRWADQPALLINSIIGNLTRKEPGAHRKHFERLQKEGDAAAQRLIAASHGISHFFVSRLVLYVRYTLGLREHPKYLLVRCLWELRKALTEAAQGLVATGRITAIEDIFFLRYEEILTQVENQNAPDVHALIAARKEEHERNRHMNPPLVMTSEGEIPQRPQPKDLPPNALSGLGASAGIIEGVAHVVLDPSSEVLHAGEILVAPYTDPGWTPLFVHAAGVICDVGGMMTHGSVIAREYGIPAVVGVGNGTKRIKSGQRLRIDGSRGIVEILDPK